MKSLGVPIAIIYLLFLPSICLAETIRIVADDWCPYNCQPGSKSPGYVVEVAREIFNKSGYQVEYKYVPWARALKEVTKGTYNGAIAATPEEVPDCIFPEEELGYYANDFIIRHDDSWHFKNIGSLKSVRLGAIKDYNYGPNLDPYIAKHRQGNAVQQLSGYNAVERNLQKLLQKKIDVYLEDRNVANYTAKKMGIETKIKHGGKEGEPIAFFIGFSPANVNSKKHAAILTKGIRDLRKSGRLAEILQKYGLADWK